MAEDTRLPEPPEEPSDSDCCGSGCTPCVFDIYEQELKLWKRECDRIKSSVPTCDQQDKEELLSPEEYKTFEILSIEAETHDSNVYRFRVPKNGFLPIGIGHHIILRGRSSNGRSVTRQYTPILHGRGFFDLVVKIYPNGPMSQYISSWKVGDLAEWRGPFGAYSYNPNTFRHLIMLAAGTGIAPMIPITRSILDNEEDETLVTLLYSCKKYNEILCKRQIDEWHQFWNFSCLYALSKESIRENISVRYGDKIQYGRINEDLIRQRIGDNASQTFIVVCGTRSFDKDMINFIKRCGIEERNFFKF